jgi:parvulin-like peptidyl-prolyl isomerase
LFRRRLFPHLRAIPFQAFGRIPSAFPEEALARCEEILTKIAAGEKFEDLAREYSDGPSGPSGGDLGEFQQGRMAPEFEKATFACEVGKTTGVVETDFGYHIILRYK